jgi:hypothetical protein
MDRYCIHYNSRTLAALASRAEQQKLPLPAWQFAFPSHSLNLALFDSVKKTNNINLHIGLNIIVYLNEDSPERAKEISKSFTETILNLVSFATLTYCGSAKLVTLIRIGDSEPSEFEHYSYPFFGQELIGSLSAIEESTFGLIFDAYRRSAHQQRILRALTWLRKGLGEEATVDEFVSYWVGLEVIKHILRRKLVWKIRNPGEWAGVEDIFVNKLHFQDFGTIKRNARDALLHGYRPLNDQFIKEIDGYIEPVRETLIFCIGSILGFQDAVTLAICNKVPRRIRQNPWAVLEGNMSNLPREFNELTKAFPTIDSEIVDKKFSLDQKEELQMIFKINQSFTGPSMVKLERKALQAWIDKDSGITHMDITVDSAAQ